MGIERATESLKPADCIRDLRAAWGCITGNNSDDPPPELADMLKMQGHCSDQQLLELVRIDATNRWRLGLDGRLEHYLEFLPETAPESDLAVMLIALELLNGVESSSAAGVESVRDRVGQHWLPAFNAAVEELARFDEDADSNEQTDSDQDDSFGSYNLRGNLGEGGFGNVYLAERERPFRQKVALKVLKRGMDSAAIIARFEAERQALAQMDHPGVARIYDAGMSRLGLPFFAMEYVRGEPITDYCDRHRLGIRERLALFSQVCEAVQHAHERGVIHRDIKPTNVLVAVLFDRPVAKIIDFGIAKAIESKLTEDTIFTQQGQVLGTPEYMSPEQAEMGALGVDTRTDVYSLGVLLYELLTGSRPFDLRKRALREIQRIIRDEDPPKPSTHLSSLGEHATEVARDRATTLPALRNELHRELEWIPLMAMRKDRTHRYRSPIDLAADIRSYLEQRPLQAGPESRWYRTRKFANRHTLGLSLSGVVVLAVIVSLGGLAWGLNEQTARRREVAKERDLATELLTSTVDIVQQLAPASKSSGVGRSDAKEVVDRSTAQIRASRISGSFRIRILGVLGEAYLRLGFPSQAEQLLIEAIQTTSLEPEAAYARALAQRVLAECLMRQDRAQEGRAAMNSAIATFGNIQELDPRLQRELRSELAALTKRQGQTESSDEKGRQLLEDARQQYSRLVDEYANLPGDPPLEGLIVEYDLALVESLLGDQNGAIERMSKVRDALELRYGTEFSSWINATAELGLMVAKNREFDRAQGIYQEAIRAGESTLGPGHWRVIQTWERVGNLFIAMNDYKSAQDAFWEAYTRHRVVSGKFNARARYAFKRHAIAIALGGENGLAEERMTDRFTEARDAGLSDAILEGLATDTAEMLIKAGREEDASPWQQRASSLLPQELPNNSRP